MRFLKQINFTAVLGQRTMNVFREDIRITTTMLVQMPYRNQHLANRDCIGVSMQRATGGSFGGGLLVGSALGTVSLDVQLSAPEGSVSYIDWSQRRNGSLLQRVRVST